MCAFVYKYVTLKKIRTNPISHTKLQYFTRPSLGKTSHHFRWRRRLCPISLGRIPTNDRWEKYSETLLDQPQHPATLLAKGCKRIVIYRPWKMLAKVEKKKGCQRVEAVEAKPSLYGKNQDGRPLGRNLVYPNSLMAYSGSTKGYSSIVSLYRKNR